MRPIPRPTILSCILPWRPGCLSTARIYLDGRVYHGRRDESTATYNPATRSYEKSLLLKQGAYNYRYVLQRPGRAADAAPIEGNFYETRNEYQIRIYHRPQGARYDHLVGYTRCRM